MSDFDALSPHAVQFAVESFTGWDLDGLVVHYNSYINRVYGLRDTNGQGWVAKFYRPGRWSEAALLEEHQWLIDAEAAELPVPVPWTDVDGETLGEVVLPTESGDLEVYFALFRQRGGRAFDAETDDDWLRLGRLLGRLHAVGRQRTFTHRPVFTPETTLLPQLQEILNSGILPREIENEWDREILAPAQGLRGLFLPHELQRIHGDVHRGNILDRAAEGLLLMDFDDCAWGPPVQDFWLLLPSYADKCPREIERFSAGYAEFSPESHLRWETVEPLRLMRMVHFLVWCLRQRRDKSFYLHFPDWGSDSFWRKEVKSLREQVDLCKL